MADNQMSLFAQLSPEQTSPDAGSTNGRLALCVLGSGSDGNSTAIRLGDRTVLIDAGFGPYMIARRLQEAGLRLADIDAICLTHLDHDHFRPTWVATLIKSRTPIFVHSWHADVLRRTPATSRLWGAGIVKVFDDRAFEPSFGFKMWPIQLAHDTKGTCGFRIETTSGSIGYATDLGHVPAQLIEHFSGVDLLAMESNYDPYMQRSSGRPIFLQRRIMGKLGHLSNQQAFEAVCAITDRSDKLQHVVLLHRSRQCNCPTIVRDMFQQDARLADLLVLAEQRTCTPWLTVNAQV